jgi:hypothetical protein
VRLSSGRLLVAALLVVSVAAAIALSQATTFTPRSELAPNDTLTPTATPFSPHVVTSPLPSAGGPMVSSPQSAPALPGVVYSVGLLAPCAVLIDFDGGFWTSPSGFELLKPIEPATVTLLRTGGVVLETGGGQEVRLRRVPGPITIPACPPRR